MIEAANIPAELKALRQWVCWRRERVCGKEGVKVPKIAGSRQNASHSDPNTWRSFKECLQAWSEHRRHYAGIGYVFASDDPYVGIDLDEVRGPDSGELTPRAQATLERLDSYAEVSPSGEGVKVWIRADLDRAHKKPGLEIYPHRRYFTVTGEMLPYGRTSIEDRGRELEWLIEAEFPHTEKEPPRREYAGPPGAHLDLVEFLEAAGVRILGEVPDGSAARVFRIVCPWAYKHTGGDVSGTRVGQYADGALFFCCEHAHCGGRRWPEFRAEVEPPSPAKKRRARRRKLKVKRVWR